MALTVSSVKLAFGAATRDRLVQFMARELGTRVSLQCGSGGVALLDADEKLPCTMRAGHASEPVEVWIDSKQAMHWQRSARDTADRTAAH